MIEHWIRPLKNAGQKKERIAIIGAGASGITAALELQKQGHEIVIYEKQERIGGKALSYPYKGKIFDLGSMTFSKNDDIATLAKKLEIPFEHVTADDIYISKGQYTNPVAYASESYSMLQLLDAFFIFRKIYKSNHLSNPGYKSYKPELYQPFSTFIQKNKLEPIAKAVEPAITGFGYGFYDEVPTIYALKIMGSMLNSSFLSTLLTHQPSMCRFPSGWAEVWQKAAQDLDVRTSAHITTIKRDTKRKKVFVTMNDTTETFDKLIIACPFNKLETFVDLSKSEQTLFRKIEHYRMVSTLVEGSIPLKTGFIVDNACKDRLGHILGIESYDPDTKCYVLFQLAPPDMPLDDVRDLGIADLRLLGSKVKKVVVQKEWEYFYHVQTKALEQGFYEKMNALQGKRQTYYLGSVLNFESVAFCQEYAHYVIKKYFSS